MTEILPPGSCKHRPISNGWGASTTQPPFSWCGYCRAFVEHDAEWTAKFPHSPTDSGCPLPSASVGQMSQLTEGVTC